MTDLPPPDAATDINGLIDHILARYHAAHRADLATLHPLASRVEAVHATDPAVPAGLTDALVALAEDLETHMQKEEVIQFPAMRAGGGHGIEQPIAVMRADHDDHGATIARIRALTADLTPPPDACGSWRALYSGMAKLLDDIAAHVALENDVLFPPFERC